MSIVSLVDLFSSAGKVGELQLDVVGTVGSIPLTNLPNQAMVTCPTCSAALSVPHVLLNFLREGRSVNPSLDHAILKLQKLIEGLGVVQVQDFEDMVSSDIEGRLTGRSGEARSVAGGVRVALVVAACC
jgi:hypothetical protein